MRYFALICVGLLSLILVLQVRILSLLDSIANRRIPVSSVVASDSPAVSAIAAEVVRQMEKQEPPSFSFHEISQSYVDDKLERANVWVKRRAGPASMVDFRPGPGIRANVKQGKSDESNCELYTVELTPEGADFLPKPCLFSVSYTDNDGNEQQREYDVALRSSKYPSAGFQITEKRPNTALEPTPTAP